MRIKNIGYRLPGWYKVAALATKFLDMSKTAKYKYTIVQFAERHGIPAAADMAKASERTVRRWRKDFRENGYNGLQNSYGNMNRNPAKWHPLIKNKIRELRTAHPNIGARKIVVLLGETCIENDIKCPSCSTIERIIRSAPDKMRTKPIGSKAKRIVNRAPKERKDRGFKAKYPGHCIALDTIVRIIWGQRIYTLVAIDLYTRMAFPLVSLSHRSSVAAGFLRLLPGLFNCKIENILTDNGSEFAKYFTKEAKRLGIRHMHTPPRTPKANAHCERFNRTYWEEFAVFFEHLLTKEGLQEFNKLLLNWILFYNCKRPHEGLNYATPAQVMDKHNFGHFDRSCTTS